MNENDMITERITPILEDLSDRLDLSDEDWEIMHAAFVEAAVAGFKVGAGHVAWSAHLQGVGVDVNYLAEGLPD